MILDAGVLISIDRADHSAQAFLRAALGNGTPLVTTHPVVAQVFRNSSRQARLNRFLSAVVIVPFDDGRQVGALLARSATSDVVDAHLVAVAARLGEPILTGDAGDIGALVAVVAGERPDVFAWPASAS